MATAKAVTDLSPADRYRTTDCDGRTVGEIPATGATIEERFLSYQMKCPKCRMSLDGGPIPENIRENYAPHYRWYRGISIYDRDRDVHDHWRCPDCKHEWH